MSSAEQSAIELASPGKVRKFVGVTIDVASADLEFTYGIPKEITADIRIGCPVLVKVSNRLRRGWVTTLNPKIDIVEDKILDISNFDNYDLNEVFFGLSSFAAYRYGTTISHFLKHIRSATLATPILLSQPREGSPKLGHATNYLRVSPCDEIVAVIASIISPLCKAGSRTLVLVSNEIEAKRYSAGLSKAGIRCVYLDRRTTKLRRNMGADFDCVVMTRLGVFAPIASLGAILVVDPEDKGHQNLGEPTWLTSVIASERARLEDCRLILTSGYPSPEFASFMRMLKPATEQSCWPMVQIVDLADHVGSLVNSDLTEWIRASISSGLASVDTPIALVLNRHGKVNRFICKKCKQSVRCEKCDALLVMGAPYLEPGRISKIEYLHHYEFRTERARIAYEKLFPRGLTCPNCRSSTPVSCGNCKSSTLVAVSVGTKRLRDELEAAIGISVDVIDQATPIDYLRSSVVVVGTESLFLRLNSAAAVAFVDFDQYLFSASFHNLNVIFRAWYKSAVIIRNGWATKKAVISEEHPLLIQTREPSSEVLTAITHRAPDRLLALDRKTREELDLPPYCALAEIKGTGAYGVMAELEELYGEEPLTEFGTFEVVPTGNDKIVIKATDHTSLSGVLGVVRSLKADIVVHVDPREV